jgi:PAN domain/Concanavalin A-like lectin/glucanases superfamily
MIIGGVVFLIILLVVGYYMSKSSSTGTSGGVASVSTGVPPPPPTTGGGVASAPTPPALAGGSTLNAAAAYVGPSTGSTYPGNDLGNFSNADPNFCADKCNNTPGCFGFTVDTGGQGCYLKSKFESPVASTTTNAYTKPGTVLPDGASKYQPPVTGHFIGNELGSFASIDPNACAAKCNSTQGCVAFEVDASNCIVKSQLTNPIDTSNAAAKVYKKPGVTPIDPISVTQKQVIQAEPMEISGDPKVFAVPPTGYSTQVAPTFTMSMDLRTQVTNPGYGISVFDHHGGLSMGISGSFHSKGANHPAISWPQQGGLPTNVAFATGAINPGTWTKVAIVCSGGAVSVYINGSLDVTMNGNFAWPTANNPVWSWSGLFGGRLAYGSVQVRNVFFWPFSLTTSQLAAITPVSSAAALPDIPLPAPAPAPSVTAGPSSSGPVTIQTAITGPGTIAIRPEANGFMNSLVPGKQFTVTSGTLSTGAVINPGTVYTVDSYTPMNIQAAGWNQMNFHPQDTFHEHSTVIALMGGGGAATTDVPGYKAISGLDFPNNDLANLPSSDLKGCFNACQARSDCKGFVVATDSQNCWLKGVFGASVVSSVRPTYVKTQQSIFAGLLGSNKVTLYVDCNWSGLGVSLPPGAYPDIAAAGFPQNALSAVRVPDGMSITIYEKVNFGGQGVIIKRDEGCFVTASSWSQNGWWNDKTCSVIIS